MAATDFTTSILVDQTPAEVYKAVNNVAAWWHGEIKGPSKRQHDEFDYRFESFHFSKQKVLELVPDKKVVWLVTDSELSFTKNKSEWTGTKIIFEIAEVNGKTQLRFTHQGLLPKFECYEACSGGWSQLIQKSLFSLITTGKGQQVF